MKKINLIKKSIQEILPKKVELFIRSLVNRGAYRHLLKNLRTKIYPKYITKDSLVFDIGACAGDLSKIFLSLGKKVISVEPNPYTYLRLKKRFKDNPEVTTINKGVSYKKDSLPFYCCNDIPLSSFSMRHTKMYPGRKWKKITIKTCTLDELIKKYGIPDYCKIDVERYELEALKGLTKKIPIISIEFTLTDLNRLKECLIYLEGIGNKKFSILDKDKIYFKRGTNKEEVINFIQERKIDSGDIFCT